MEIRLLLVLNNLGEGPQRGRTYTIRKRTSLHEGSPRCLGDPFDCIARRLQEEQGRVSPPAIAMPALSVAMVFRFYVAEQHRTPEHGDEHQQPEESECKWVSLNQADNKGN